MMIHNTEPDNEWVPWDLTPFSGAFFILFMMLFAGNVAFIIESNMYPYSHRKQMYRTV